MAKTQISQNLYLFDNGKGGKYYIVRFMHNKRAVERSLGSIKKLSIRDAKRLAPQVIDDYINGVEKSKKPSLTFADVIPLAMADIARQKQWKNPKSEAQWLATLNKYAKPVIGHLPINKIEYSDVMEVLQPIWFTKTVTANRLRSRIEAVIAWAIRRGYREGPNPAVWKQGFEFDLPKPKSVKAVKHHEALTFDEIRKSVKYCLAHPSPVCAAILFGIATVGRVSEFVNAKRSEIDCDVWFVPPERRKDKKPYPHRVPLSPLALIALEMASSGDDLFVNSNGKVINAESPRKKLVKIINRKVTMHGCRSTFSDWCDKNQISDTLCEKSLMHAVGNEVAQAYHRSDLLELRVDVMNRWSDFLMEK